MHRPRFEALARQLSDAGIAPRFVLRLGRELQDHFADLEEESLRRQNCPDAASAEASERLGNDQVIAHEFLNRPELRSWVYTSHTLLLCLRAASWLVIVTLRLVFALGSLPATLARYTAAAGIALIGTATLLLGLQMLVEAPQRQPRRVAHVVTTTGMDVTMAPESEASPAEAVPEVSGVSLQVRVSPRLHPSPAELDPLWGPSRAFAAEDPPSAPRPVPALAAMELGLPDGDFLPIVRVAPVFPAIAASRGIEGYVVIEYTVTPRGTVQDPTVVESSNVLFERSAVEAISKFKYKPRVLGGRAVAVSGVRTRVRFVLDV